MTYVRYLALGGFKGFRDWNLLEFDPRVSVLVGGNGSGKTSLVEALLWALGEDDPAMLRIADESEILYRRPASAALTPARSEREQHLLFIDPRADAREDEADPDVDEAAVYLVLGDESACGCEAEDEEDSACCCTPAGRPRREVPEGLVTVSRFLTADGGQRWEVDGAPATREDVARALRPHGLDRSLVSVVRQGELERFLVAEPWLRARIVADATGIDLPHASPPPAADPGDAELRTLQAAHVLEALRAWNAEDAVPGGAGRVLELLGLPPEVAGNGARGNGAVAPEIAAAWRSAAPALEAAVGRVSDRFARHFDRLVPGGRVELALTTPESAPPGLEISVCFPGCDTEGIESLSGGQRALVAFSLGVALFQETPARLMVLDEVEPALDENNLRRFNALLHEVAEERQVVVVSHQRRTKEVGDVVFGTNQTGDGASMLQFRFEPATKRLILFGRARGNWLDRTAALEQDLDSGSGPRSISVPEPRGGEDCC